MFEAFAGVIGFGREVWEAIRLQEMRDDAPRVAVYAEDSASWKVLGPYVLNAADRGGLSIDYVTSAPEDPRLQAPPHHVRVTLLRRAVPWWIAHVRAAAFLTTMPDLARLHVPRPPVSTRVIYTFHSLISTHEGYRPGAFDHYDVFFCAGPHHKLELETYFQRSGRPVPELLEVGYARLDALAERCAEYTRPPGAAPTVLVAPSWGRGNVLEAAGVPLVEQLRASGFDVIVRPHPCFWQPIYPQGRACVGGIVERFRDDAHVTVEPDINSDDAFLKADLLVSDYSGAAYEFAFAARRPVLFFDGPRKTLNPDWRALGLPVFEDTMRDEVGERVAPDRIEDAGRIAERLLRDAPRWAGRLAEQHHRHVYHPGRSAEVGAAALRDIVARGVRA